MFSVCLTSIFYYFIQHDCTLVMKIKKKKPVVDFISNNDFGFFGFEILIQIKSLWLLWQTLWRHHYVSSNDLLKWKHTMMKLLKISFFQSFLRPGKFAFISPNEIWHFDLVMFDLKYEHVVEILNCFDINVNIVLLKVGHMQLSVDVMLVVD